MKKTYTTAGHCGGQFWYNGGRLIRSTSAIQYQDGELGDAQIISLYTPSALGAVWNSTILTDTEEIFVGSWALAGSQEVGDRGICADGAVSGQDCSSRIFDTDVCLTDHGGRGVEICGLNIAENVPVVRPGDSGGPVYKGKRDGTVEALGLIDSYVLFNRSLWLYTPIDIVNNTFNVVPITSSP